MERFLKLKNVRNLLSIVLGVYKAIGNAKYVKWVIQKIKISVEDVIHPMGK